MPRNEIGSAPGSQARVVATFGRRFALSLDDGTGAAARVKGRALQPVCGDRVEAVPLPNEPDWLITGLLPRANELTRPNMRGGVEVLAANLDALVVVTADFPAADWFIADRYLCAAELMGAAAAVAFNKIDLGAIQPASMQALAEYHSIGYATLRLSAGRNENVGALLEFLAGRRAILVGQSGVGKSSLINRLVEDSLLPTGAVSKSRREGRHTTANSVMLSLPNGGAVIDSPGVRDYAPAVAGPAEVARGFREVCEAAAECRFANCRHLREPGCEVKARVADGRIGARRYESYKRMLANAERIARL
ncbi:MAG TPA: ribosome small subunit-dependent GTPase A [Woeseiaceae bacterium]|nr:ribosome small subunit-dependent GTPase A [Woeseiaceae bacterium]